MLLAALGGMGQGNQQLIGAGGKFGGLTVQVYVLDGEAHGIKLELGHVVAVGGNILADLTADLALIEIEPKMRANIFEVVILAAGIRFIGTRQSCENGQQQGQNRQGPPRLRALESAVHCCPPIETSRPGANHIIVCIARLPSGGPNSRSPESHSMEGARIKLAERIVAIG